MQKGIALQYDEAIGGRVPRVYASQEIRGQPKGYLDIGIPSVEQWPSRRHICEYGEDGAGDAGRDRLHFVLLHKVKCSSWLYR